MKIDSDEVLEAEQIERHAALVELSWKHLIAADKRYDEDVLDSKQHDANIESNLVQSWMNTYRGLMKEK